MLAFHVVIKEINNKNAVQIIDMFEALMQDNLLFVTSLLETTIR